MSRHNTCSPMKDTPYKDIIHVFLAQKLSYTSGVFNLYEKRTPTLNTKVAASKVSFI